VLAREVMARGDGAVSTGSVARALRAAYPACFTYLLSGGDGTALAGASPELLVRRAVRIAHPRDCAVAPPNGLHDRPRAQRPDHLFFHAA